MRHLVSPPALAAAVLALAPPALAQGFEPPTAVDLDPDPDVVEVRLTASETTWQFKPGVDTTVYAYDGSIPGPTIRAEVGDTLIVHFTNDLPEETTIHWHGVETPADMDGSHVSQLTVPPGGTFDYEFPLLRDGMYWYHPHVRPFDQVEKGLYGVLLVHDPAVERALGLDRIVERVVVFDDVLLDADDQIVPAFSFTDPLENAMYQVNGREGNVLLVNGREAPYSATVLNGKPQRWRVLNAANTTFCRLDLNDSADGLPSMPVWQIGSDGGFLAQPFLRLPATLPSQKHGFYLFSREAIFLTPGERMDVVFTPHGAPGTTLSALAKDWVRGRHAAAYDSAGAIILPDDPLDGRYPARPFLEMTISGPDPGPPYYAPPSPLSTLAAPDPSGAAGVLPVTFGHGFPDAAGNITMFAQARFDNGTMTPLPAPKVDSLEAFDVQVGETWIWELKNLTHGDHPFHAHGFQFVPYEVEAVDLNNPANNEVIALGPMRKDTVRVPPRRGLKGSSYTIVRALVVFDDTGREGLVQAQGHEPTFAPDGSWTSGGWLFHCHVLEHSAKGMLSFLEVHDPGDPYWLLGKGNPGTNGLASLTVEGPLSAGSTVQAHVVNAYPSATTMLIAGFTLLDYPIVGGTLVPSIDSYALGTTDAEGDVSFDLLYPGLPMGTKLWMQGLFVDPAGPNGLVFTNAVQVNIP